ncbi:MAG: DUF4010 domain-containing protein [Alphaproteobacteria bacterium]|nr:DUF4010 domain-containing protein [Alphaproteobacteria bacterium]
MCYVHNFKEPHKPRALKLPPGQGHELRRDMEQLVDETVSGIQALFEGENYRTRREAIDEEFRERQSNALESFGERARGKGVALIRTPGGLALALMKNGEVVPPEVFRKLPREEQEKTGHDIEELQSELRALMQQMPRVEKERRERIRELDREITMFAVGHSIEILRDKYRSLPDVVGYLEAVRDDMIERAAELRPREEESSQLPFMMRGPSDPAAAFRRFRVNVIVGCGENGGAPVVFEDNPGYASLVGRVEHLAEMDALVTDFSLIKPGALHRANGGYLMIDAIKLLTAPFAWESLKRALKSREIRIDSPAQSLGLMTTVSFEPEPIPLDLKVVLLARLRAAQTTHDYGATTIVAAMLTFGFGALAVVGEFALTTAGAVATSALLSLKPTVHRWLARIDHRDLIAVLKLLAISLVLLPALPDRGFAPWQTLNPFQIWLMVVLVAALSFARYVVMRVVGAWRGLALASVAGGLVSSTAVAIAFAHMAGANPRHRRLLAAGTVAAATIMVPRLLVLVAAVEPTLLGHLAGHLPPRRSPVRSARFCFFAARCRTTMVPCCRSRSTTRIRSASRSSSVPCSSSLRSAFAPRTTGSAIAASSPSPPYRVWSTSMRSHCR